MGSTRWTPSAAALRVLQRRGGGHAEAVQREVRHGLPVGLGDDDEHREDLGREGQLRPLEGHPPDRGPAAGHPGHLEDPLTPPPPRRPHPLSERNRTIRTYSYCQNVALFFQK